MQNEYPVVIVDSAARLDDEPMGTKEKFWYEMNGISYLFKKSRTGTGEDWSEKAGREVARCLGVPAAEVELAVYRSEEDTHPLHPVQAFVESSRVLPRAATRPLAPPAAGQGGERRHREEAE